MLKVLNNIRFHAMLVPIYVILVTFTAYLVLPLTEVSNVLSVFCIGALGGTTSTYYRLKDLPAEREVNKVAILQVYTTPLVAGIFACILFIALVSQIIDGELFPNFVYQEGSERGKFVEFLWAAYTESHSDSAKLFLWSFIAGFVERIVPNMIDKIASEGEKDLAPQQEEVEEVPGETNGPV